MNTFTKRVAIVGAGTAASAVLIVGLAMPANAATSDRTSSSDTSSSETTTATSVDLLGDFRNEIPVVIGGLGTVDGGVANGGILNGGVVNGPLVDDSLTSDIGDVASGNSTDVGGVANGTDVGDIANGTDVSTGDVQAPVGSGNDTSTDVSDLGGDISGTVDDLTGGDITGGNVTGNLSDTIDGTVSDLTDNVTGGLDLGAILR